MGDWPKFTVEEVRATLTDLRFAEYDHDGEGAPGFTVFKAAFGPEIVVTLKGVLLIEFNEGEGPRAVIGEYAGALDLAGYEVRQTGSDVVVAGVKP